MTKLYKLSALITLNAIFGLATSVASADTYKPANFDFTGKQFVETMATISSGDHVLYCRSDITATGDAQNTRCFGKTLSYSTVHSAERALDQLPFNSAQVNSKNVPVRMSFRVSLSERDSNTKAQMVPNLGTMNAKYGSNYSEPQERLDVSDWHESYSEKSTVKGERFFSTGSNARIAAEVSTNGKASAVGVIESKKALKNDSKLAAQSLKESRFIPGMVDGKAVKMDYITAINHSDGNKSLAAK